VAEIKIGDRLIGVGHPTYIIAEVGVNHNGIPQLAFELIDIAVDAGADAVVLAKVYAI
jgi:N-acetylneuraminate synthase